MNGTSPLEPTRAGGAPQGTATTAEAGTSSPPAPPAATVSHRRLDTILGVGLLCLGGLFLLGNLVDVDLWHYVWPVSVLIPGLVLLAVSLLGRTGLAYLAIPGAIVTMAGLLLFYQTITGDWASWSYAWALVAPFSVGVGLFIAGSRAEEPGLREAGKWVALVGIGLFFAFGFFFQVILGVGGRTVGRVVWPLVLIAFGVWLLASTRRST